MVWRTQVRALSGLVNSVAVGVAYVADVTSEENRTQAYDACGINRPF